MSALKQCSVLWTAEPSRLVEFASLHPIVCLTTRSATRCLSCGLARYFLLFSSPSPSPPFHSLVLSLFVSVFLISCYLPCAHSVFVSHVVASSFYVSLRHSSIQTSSELNIMWTCCFFFTIFNRNILHSLSEPLPAGVTSWSPRGWTWFARMVFMIQESLKCELISTAKTLHVA
jgi:hypothetical protein